MAVIAHRQVDFKDFMHWVDLNDRRYFVFVRCQSDLQGRLFCGVLRIGNYKKLKDHEDLFYAALG